MDELEFDLSAASTEQLVEALLERLDPFETIDKEELVSAFLARTDYAVLITMDHKGNYEAVHKGNMVVIDGMVQYYQNFISPQVHLEQQQDDDDDPQD